jgi:hypothetical protein
LSSEAKENTKPTEIAMFSQFSVHGEYLIFESRRSPPSRFSECLHRFSGFPLAETSRANLETSTHSNQSRIKSVKGGWRMQKAETTMTRRLAPNPITSRVGTGSNIASCGAALHNAPSMEAEVAATMGSRNRACHEPLHPNKTTDPGARDFDLSVELFQTGMQAA